MVQVNKNGLKVEPIMKVFGSKMKDMDKEFVNMKMVRFIKEPGKIINDMAWEFIWIKIIKLKVRVRELMRGVVLLMQL